MAELPHIGKHCGVLDCNRLDFLPVRCDACANNFCNNHFTHSAHNCEKAYSKNVQVPVCPLCAQPVPTPRDIAPDVHVNEHIINNCAKAPKKKIFNKKCNVPGCRKKELIPFTCPKCALNYCIGHRHEVDHKCANKGGKIMSNSAISAVARDRLACSREANMPQISEDEALARALAASLNSDSGNASLSPEEIDRRLAEQLQIEENQRNNGRPQRASAGGDKCTVC